MPAQDRDATFFATRWGVYYPKRHVVVALGDSELARRFKQDLRAEGFEADSLREVPSGEMAEFLRRTAEHAGAAAEIVSSELEQMEILLQLAQTGCDFLIVRVDDDSQKQALLRAGERHPLRKAIHYHILAIEELPIAEAAIPGPSPYGTNETPRKL